MAKYKTCVICGEYIEGNDIPSMIPYKNRYAHKKCFDRIMKTLKTEKDSLLKEKEKEKKTHKGTRPKPPVELKEGMSEEEYKEKKDYYDYLRSLVGDNITAKTYALTELYMRKYGFTYTGMRDTLAYIHEVLQMDIKGDVVGLIPYQYSACEAYQAQ